MKSRENELNSLWEKKEATYISQIRQFEDRIKFREQEFFGQLSKKDDAIKNEEAMWAEKLLSKDKDVAELQRVANELKVDAAKKHENIREMEEKVQAYAKDMAVERMNLAEKEREFGRHLSIKTEEFKAENEKLLDNIRAKDANIAELANKEKNLDVVILKNEEYIRKLESGIREASLSFERAKKEAEESKEEYKKKQAIFEELLKSKEKEAQEYVIREKNQDIILARNEEYIKELSEKFEGLKQEKEKASESLRVKDIAISGMLEKEKDYHGAIAASRQK